MSTLSVNNIESVVNLTVANTITIGNSTVNTTISSAGVGGLRNLTATAAPTSGDDTGDGYGTGSLWHDVTNDRSYVCIDATLGSAIWREIGYPAFDTRAAAVAARISSNIDRIETRGYTSSGDGGAAVYKAVGSEPSHAGKFQSADGQWWELSPERGFVTPKQFGAVGDGSTDDTTACQNAANAAGIIGCELLIDDVYSVSTVDFNYERVIVRGLGFDTGFVGRSAASVVRSLLANRIVAGSIENLRFINFKIDGASTATNGFELERWTRGCSIESCRVEECTTDGIDLLNCWSFTLKDNHIEDCDGKGIHMREACNAFHASGNHVEGCGQGWVVDDGQGYAIIGNTSEYNLAENFICSGRSAYVVGNYFEAFDPSVSGASGDENCVQLGTASFPFLYSVFDNYVNGGSNSGTGFTGNGVRLVNVRMSQIRAAFSLSTNFEFSFLETDTIIGCEFAFSSDAQAAVLGVQGFRNLTDSVTGGLEVFNGTSIYGNTLRRAGDNFGIRLDYQVEPDTTTGSLVEHRIIENQAVAWRYGKLSSTGDAFVINNDSQAKAYWSDTEVRFQEAYDATTASAANVFVDTDGQLLRSTSSRKYKTDIQPLDDVYAEKLLSAAVVWYRSLAPNDRPDWSYYGLIAEDVADLDPRLVHWGYSDADYELVDVEENGEQRSERRLKGDAVKKPEGVQYERLTVLLLALVQRLWAKTVSPAPVDGMSLETVKTRLVRDIGDDAERERLKYVTPGSAKAMSYQEKLAEARLVLDDPQAADPALTPILAREAEIRGLTLEQTASLVHQTYLAWKAIEARLNEIEMAGKLAVQSAESVEAARAAYEAINWTIIEK